MGYGIPTKTAPGVWSDSITERVYTGDFLDIMATNSESDKVNNDIRLQQQISVVADAFALENFTRIRYVSWMGVNWAVASVKVQRPRLILRLGGVYHGPSAAVSVS